LSILEKGKIPVIVGGSGLYIRCLCDGLFENDYPISELENGYKQNEIRSDLEIKLIEKGIDFLYQQLKEVDTALYDLYSDKNPRRIIRALEYFYINGNRLSDA